MTVRSFFIIWVNLFTVKEIKKLWRIAILVFAEQTAAYVTALEKCARDVMNVPERYFMYKRGRRVRYMNASEMKKDYITVGNVRAFHVRYGWKRVTRSIRMKNFKKMLICACGCLKMEICNILNNS